MTDKQKAIGQAYSTKALAVIDDQSKFDEVMREFEEWKKVEETK